MRMRVESLTRQRQVLQTVWPVRIVRIDDSSCWVVVVGKPRRTSSSNSGIAKTSADLALVSVIIEAFVIERWYHMCYTVYIFFVSADLHLQVQHGPHIKGRSIEVYANAELRERAIHCLLTHGCPTNVAGWKDQSLHIKRLSTRSSPPSKVHHCWKMQSKGSFISLSISLLPSSSSIVQIHMPQSLRSPILALATSPVRDSQAAAAAIKTLRHVDGRIVIIIVIPLLSGLDIIGLLL